MASDNQFQAQITEFKSKIYELQGQIYSLNGQVSRADAKIKEKDYEISVLKKELDTYKDAVNLEKHKDLLNQLQESEKLNRVNYQRIQELYREKGALKYDLNKMKKKHESMFENPKGGGDKKWNIPSQTQYLVNMTAIPAWK
jgi:chromosome segregation ATPase